MSYEDEEGETPLSLLVREISVKTLEDYGDEILESLAHMEAELRQLKDKVGTQNGRVAKLEDWRHQRELAIGRQEAHAEALATFWKRQVAVVSVVAGMISAAASVAVRFL